MSIPPAPSRERLTELFLEFTRLRSPSKDERPVADAIKFHLAGSGVSLHEDDTGAAIAGNTGNLWCLVRGESTVPQIALGAHMDTVEPPDSIEPVLEDGIFRNAVRGILGADDKAAVVGLVHATELLRASGHQFPSYELFFTVSEETGLVGAKHMDTNVLSSPLAAVFDASGPVGGITVKAPSQQALNAIFHGRAAHAGVEPERGRSAIQAAAQAISMMHLGRIDEESSANIGVIQGGTASNIVPDLCEVRGECRSHDDEKLAHIAASMVDALQEGAAHLGVDVDVSLVNEYHAFALTGRAPVVRLSKAAISALGLEPVMKTAGGGSDANILNGRGLPTVNLDAGMMQVHSPDEHLALDDLERLCALILNMIMLAPEYSPRRSTSLGGARG
ncbi:MAG: M20/M25/M40 family metallo-hydrolase [Actinobacteria bacterium]|nr:M20/M25/M40 family metallo-hydrolase [Actinomycetota bacterium]